MKAYKDRSIAFAWVGMIGVAVFIIAWICAAAIDTTWQFGTNTLSELGISSTDASYYFNYGCRVTGILIAIFAIGRTAYAKNAGHDVGGILLFFGGAALALVGVYTMNDGEMHKYVALAAAWLIYLAMISIAAGNWAANRKILAGIGVVFVFVLAAMFFAYDLATLEAYGIIIAIIWFLLESTNMIISSRKG